MMKNVRRISNKYYLRQIVACWLTLYMLFIFGMPAKVAMADSNPPAGALPSGESVVAGSVGNFNRGISNELHIENVANGTIINWGNFDIGSKALTEFQQAGGPSSAVLNKVSGDVTGIMGTLTANGRVFIVNPAGIIFGKYATINVAQLVASSLDISNTDFINGLSTGNFQFTGGELATGDVTFKTKADRVTAERIYLVGKNVINNGGLVASDYVIMAAGDTVLIREIGSNVFVEPPTMGSGSPSDFTVSNYDVPHSEAKVESEHVILAAGDIFSAAYIGACSDGSPDAAATVNMNAAGNVDIEDDVMAEATGYGDNTNSAIAGITITAAGDVEIGDNHHDVAIEAKATSEDGINTSADISINAGGNVSILAGDRDVKIKAEASNKLDEGDLVNGAIGGFTNTANINITGASVEIRGECRDDAIVEAVAKNVIDLTPEIPALGEGEEAAVLDLTIQGLTNTANVDIAATGGNVDVIAEGYHSGAEAMAKATATNEMKVKIVNPVEDEAPAVTVNLNVADLTNSAGVTINANGEECSDVAVEGNYGYGLVRAEAYNTLEVEHKGWCERISRWDWDWVEVAPATLNLTVDGLQNTAAVDITATNGSVYVTANGGSGWWDWNPYTAGVEAEAYNSFKMDDLDSTTTGNLTLNNLANTANIGITAGYDVEVLAENGGEAGIRANAWNELEPSEEASGDIIQDNMINDAGVTIDAGGSVKVEAECFDQPSKAEITAEAYNDTPQPENDALNIVNTANIDITAGDEVKVIGKDGGEAGIEAATWHGTENTSGVTVNSGGDVLVLGVDGDASIEAVAEEGGDNTATIAISAVGGDVKVIDIGGEGGGDTAKIEARADGADNSNTADVTINATAEEITEDGQVVDIEGGDVLVLGKDGGKAAITAYASEAGEQGDAVEVETSNTANVTIHATSKEATIVKDIGDGVFEEFVLTEGGDVKVIGKDGGEASIEAVAQKGTTNTANVGIDADSDVLVIAACEDRTSEATIKADAEKGEENNASVSLGGAGHKIGGDVKVIAKYGGDAEIKANAEKGFANTADVLICTEGELKVIGKYGGDAEVEAKAQKGSTNTASLAIGAVDGVLVKGEYGGDAEISSKAEDGQTNSATTQVCSKEGGIEVIAEYGGEAQIAARAEDGIENTAKVFVRADDDVLVRAGSIDTPGCEAKIEAVAEAAETDADTSTDAQVNVISDNGGVGVVGFNGGDAKIQSLAKYGTTSNTAYAGVSAGGDLDIILSLPEWMQGWFEEEVGFIPNVLVKAFGEGSNAWIWSFAMGAKGYDTINTADTVVCTPGEVFVGGAGGYAAIKSWAFGWGEGAENYATTEIYAGNGVARGLGEIGEDNVDIVFGGNAEIYAKTMGIDGQLKLCLTETGEIAAYGEGSGATLIISNWASRKNCPTCPPCPCEGGPTPPPPGPINAMQFASIVQRVPAVEGCPALLAAAASELGMTSENINVAMANSTASATDIQPCDTCARLLAAARILRDEDGSRMAALAEVINTVAPANVPFSPEVGTMIAAAFEGHKGDGTAYATALDYIDAFVQYVSILDTEMSSPAGDSVAFTMGKYGQGIQGNANANVAAYLASRLEQIGG